MSALAAVLLTIDAAAGAGLGLKYVFNSREVPDESQRDLGAECPAGTQAVGGGAEISGIDGTLEIAATSPFDGPDSNSKDDDGWVATASNESGGPETLGVTVICAKSGKYKYVSGELSVPDGEQGGRFVRCPAGTKVTGGGAEIGGGEDNQLARTLPLDGNDRNSRPDEGWHASANNFSGSTETLTVFAICAKTGTYKYVSSEDSPSSDEVLGKRVRCPAGTKVTGGGVDTTGDGGEVAGTSPFASRGPDPDAGWEGLANNDSGASQTATVYAICKKK